MATIIDALLVTLSLDSKGFKQGSADAEKSLKQTSEASNKAAKEIEANGRKAAQFFGAIKVEALSLLAIFTAGMGLTEFASKTIASAQQLQNLSSNLQQSASEVKAWEGVFTRAGGSAQDATALFSRAADEIGKLKSGQGVGQALQAIGMSGGNLSEAMKCPREMVMEEARVLEKLNAIDPLLARSRAQMMGLSDAQFSVMKQGPAALEAQVAAQEKLNGLNDAQIKKLAQVQAMWQDFKTGLEGVATSIIGDLAPVLEAVSTWAAKHGPAIGAAIIAIGAAIVAAMTPAAVATLAATWPVLALAAAIATAAAGIGYLYEQWTTFTNGGKTSFDSLFRFLQDTWKAIKSLFFGNASEIRAAWKKLFGDIGDMWDDLIHAFTKAGPAILQAFKSGLASAFDWAKGRVKAIWNAITGGKDENAQEASPAPAKAAPSTVAAVKQAVSNAANGAADSAFGALISKGEGDYDSVNRGAKHGYKAGKENLAGMTISEVMAHQDAGDFKAAGRYQVMPENLKAAAKALGLSGGEKFDKATQDRVFEQYLLKNKRKAIGDYLSGQSNDLHAAMKAAAKEWASVADPDTGKSYYAGVGNNKASISVDQLASALQSARASQSGRGNSTSSSEVNIQQVTIQTQATDAQGMAKDAQAAFQKHPLIVPQANLGLT